MTILLYPTGIDFIDVIADPREVAVKRYLAHYMNLTPDQADLIARYVVFTYREHPVDFIPTLYIGGVPGVGKTQLLVLLNQIVAHPFVVLPRTPLHLVPACHTLLMDNWSHRSYRQSLASLPVAPKIVAFQPGWEEDDGKDAPEIPAGLNVYLSPQLRDAREVSWHTGPEFEQHAARVRGLLTLSRAVSVF